MLLVVFDRYNRNSHKYIIDIVLCSANTLNSPNVIHIEAARLLFLPIYLSKFSFSDFMLNVPPLVFVS